MRVRKIKTISFTFGEIADIEGRVNAAVDELAKESKRVVSISSNNFGLSPMTLIYTIIYEETVPDKDTSACGQGEQT